MRDKVAWPSVFYLQQGAEAQSPAPECHKPLLKTKTFKKKFKQT